MSREEIIQDLLFLHKQWLESQPDGLLEQFHKFSHEEIKTVVLSDLLEEGQLIEVQALFQRAQETNASDQELVQALKEQLNHWKDQLEAKGVLPDYLAYALLSKWKGIS